MRLIFFIYFLTNSVTFAAARSIFEGKNSECQITNTVLRQGNISMGQIPCIILNIINNLLSFVGTISLFVIVWGAVLYTFGGFNESWGEKGKTAIKMALLGAITSWSGWFLVNLVLDNIM